ncbi:MAG: hypothetical protein R3D57_18395 [Hyphomicrobiaceae bacterium]
MRASKLGGSGTRRMGASMVISEGLQSRTAQRLAAAAALVTFTLVAAPGLMTAPSVSFAVRGAPTEHAPADARPASGYDVPRSAELLVAAYSGLPYTHPSAATVTRPDGSTFTAHDIDWLTKPWINPVYYGVRVAGWSGSTPFGAMLDFTHSKAIATLDNEERFEGSKDGTAVPPQAKLGQVFRRLEFSHGHNILTLNGLYRLPFGSARVKPYIGVGVGVNLPHTEIWLEGDEKRTYEYQLAGPATQALVGIELRLPRATSLFLEYKFSFSWYRAPMTGRDGGWLYEDLWRQLTEEQSNKPPLDGVLRTELATHQVVGGLGIRIGGNSVAAP